MKTPIEELRELFKVNNTEYQKDLAAVQQDAYALQYVKEQTPEICLAAVKRSAYALQYVKEQTPEICLAAVQRDAYALKYISDDIKGLL